MPVWRRGIPHLAKNERDAPSFLYAALDDSASAPFVKERRMEFAKSIKLHRKSGMWGTQLKWQGQGDFRLFFPSKKVWIGFYLARYIYGD
jgi:hypothetical protein